MSKQRLGVPHAVPAIEHFEIMDLQDERLTGRPPATERIFVFVCYVERDLLSEAIARLEAAGYVAGESLYKHLCALQVMTRAVEPVRSAS